MSIANTNKKRYKKAIIHEVPNLYNVPAVEIGILSPKAKNMNGETSPISNIVIIAMRIMLLAGIICQRLYATYILLDKYRVNIVKNAVFIRR